jgi:hypothetical protein
MKLCIGTPYVERRKKLVFSVPDRDTRLGGPAAGRGGCECRVLFFSSGSQCVWMTVVIWYIFVYERYLKHCLSYWQNYIQTTLMVRQRSNPMYLLTGCGHQFCGLRRWYLLQKSWIMTMGDAGKTNGASATAIYVFWVLCICLLCVWHFAYAICAISLTACVIALWYSRRCLR